MSKELIVFGTGAHARKVYYCAHLSGWKILGFIDENPNAVTPITDIPLFLFEELDQLGISIYFVVAIGDNGIRQRLQSKYLERGWQLATIIHPTASISPDAGIGAGAVILARTVIESGSVIGSGTIVDIGSIVDHDVSVGEYCHLKPGCIIGPYGSIIDNVTINSGIILRNFEDI